MRKFSTTTYTPEVGEILKLINDRKEGAEGYCSCYFKIIGSKHKYGEGFYPIKLIAVPTKCGCGISQNWECYINPSDRFRKLTKKDYPIIFRALMTGEKNYE